MARESVLRVLGICCASAALSGAIATPAVAAPPRTTAAVSIKYSDTPDSASNPDRAYARHVIFDNESSPGQLYSRVTNGGISLRGIRDAGGDAHGTWRIPIATPPAECDLLTKAVTPYVTVWMTYLTGLVRGVDLSKYQQVFLIAPPGLTCGYAGTAGPLDRWAVINSEQDANSTASVASHEFGHNLGLVFHSMSAECEDQTFADGGQCTLNPYGDFMDVMGNDRASAWNGTPFQAHNRFRLGALDRSATKTLPEGSRGTYKLVAPGTTGGGTELLMLERTGPGRGNPKLACPPFFAELGCDKTPGLNRLNAEVQQTRTGPAVVFRLSGPLGTIDPTVLIKNNRGQWSSKAGNAITDPATRTRIKVLDVGLEGATLELVDPSAETAPASPEPSAESWHLTWPQVDDADHYEVWVDAGDGSAPKLTWTEDAAWCSHGCWVDQLGDGAAGRNARARVYSVGEQGNRSLPSAWVPLFEEGSTPTISDLRAETVVETNPNSAFEHSFFVRVTGKADIRAGLKGLVYARTTDGDWSDFLGGTDEPWTGPKTFTIPRTVRHKLGPDSASTIPEEVTVYTEASFSPRVQFTSPQTTVAVEAADRTPPSRPEFQLSAPNTVTVTNTGEPTVHHNVYFRFGEQELGYQIAGGPGPVIPLEFPQYPGWTWPAGELYVVSYDAAGNWRSSLPVPYTPPVGG